VSIASLVVLLLTFSTSALAQDPTGRPDPKKKPPTKKPPTKPEPITVTLTVLTDPPECSVFINGEPRGVTNSEGRIQFEKLPLAHYTIEVRKDGYTPVLRGFDAGTQTPTIVFKLEAKLDDYVREFNSLMASGKLVGADSAFELVEKLTNKYPGKSEVAQLRDALATRLIETATPVINQSVMNWKAVSKDQMASALDAAANALALKKDDARVQAEVAYLKGAIALRDWQVAGGPPKDGNGAGDGSGNVTGPAPARAEFENAVKLAQSFPAARYQLGVVFLLSGDASGAEAALLNVTQAEPRWASAYTSLGSAYYSGAKFKESIEAYRKALELDPNNAAAAAGLGLARVGKGEKDGVKDIERAIRLDPNCAVAHLNLAIVLSQSKSKKDWTRAEDEFKKAISLNPQNLEFQNNAAERMLGEAQKRKK